ncbi:MAG: tetratricopeptide repeat protein [Symploca sp. SIO2E9]|nr:tetratricopeptide repeat protein [Symploca sp. SIO2E9]
MFSNEVDNKNQKAYEDLLVSIEASEDILSLLIAVCDDNDCRLGVIQQYETDVQPQIRPYRVALTPTQPSLRAAIAELVETEEYLSDGGRAVLTVTGAEKLFFLKLGEERSQQEIFFGYLQWTREGLRQFPYPIVLWVTNQILVDLSKQAPDFWSWRKGVFRFVSKKTGLIPSTEIKGVAIKNLSSAQSRNALIENQENADINTFPSWRYSRDLTLEEDQNQLIPLADLQALIEQTEQQRGAKDSNLAILYERMGQIYSKRLERGEAQNYQQEQELAISYFHKAAELEQEFGWEEDFASSLNNLANLYQSLGRYEQAEPLYLQALDLRKRLLGEQHPDVASSLNNLAALYQFLGRYEQAEALYLQALDLSKRLLGEQHPDVATSLNNLANLYKSLGRYEQAEPLYLQALDLSKRLLGEEHPSVATSLNNLANLYQSLGRYEQAEALYLQALDLSKRLLGEEHPSVATSLHNLAYLYESLGRYEQAEPLYLQALHIFENGLGKEHPHTVICRKNLELLGSER